MSCFSVEVNHETVSHVGILDGIRRVGERETNNPKGDCKDEGAERQLKVTCQGPQDGSYPGLAGLLLLLLQLHSRLNPNNSLIRTNMRCSSNKHLIGGVQNHLEEGDGHGEQHPDVDHLDVRGDRQALGESQKTKKV